MSKEKIQICEDLADIMPPEYHKLVESATFGNQIADGKTLVHQQN